MKLEDIIKKLSPELQDKAKACKSPEELMALGREHAAELTPEALEAIAGGTGGNPKNCGEVKCPKCGSTKVTCQKKYEYTYIVYKYTCNDCGHTWEKTRMIE